ncbi:MAG: nitrous oxide reductase family maturation protein NosD [Gemmatimonadota bacterium]
MMTLGVLALQLVTIVVGAGGAHPSLAAAVAGAAAGDTIVVQAGVYREPAPIVISKSLHLIGRPGAILDGGGTHEILVLTADNIEVRGLVLRNTGFSYHEDRAAIHVAGGNGCRIEQNTLQDTFFAIYLASSSGCTIRGNVIRGNGSVREAATGNGIHLWSSREVTVAGNRISGHRDGIYLEFTHCADVRDNLSERNNRYGLHFMYSDSSQYRDNTFRGNGSGVAVMYTREVLMEGNRFEANRGSASYGLLLKEVQHPTLRRNTFWQNTTGLLADGADGLRAEGNRFEGNGWGIRLLGSTLDGRFSGNAFATNWFDVGVNGAGGGVVFTGNWWDSYRGWDLDGDGVGDVPHHPVRLFGMLVDRAPSALLLQRSLFVRLVDAAERAFPVLTPTAVTDPNPLMRPVVG